MQEYPFVQSTVKITDFICEDCKELKKEGFKVEWRVDIFQGNCEFENTCIKCLANQLRELEKESAKRQKYIEERERIYERIEKPKWEKLEKLLEENNIEFKIYVDTGQWTFENLIDWWTTTGTVIHRKTKQHSYFNVNNPDNIIHFILKDKRKNENKTRNKT